MAVAPLPDGSGSTARSKASQSCWDITRGTGRFNLAQGIVGTGAGVGATLSTTAAGFLADRYGMGTAFLRLAALAACGFLVVLAALKETRPP